MSADKKHYEMLKRKAQGQKELDSKRSHLRHRDLYRETHQELHRTKMLRSPPLLLTDRGKPVKDKARGQDRKTCLMPKA